MAKPPNFTGYSHEQMKDLLKAEESRRNRNSDWKLVGHTWGAWALGFGVIVLAGVGLLQIFGVLR